MIRKYRKKPVVIEVKAIKFTRDNTDECVRFVGSRNIIRCVSGELISISNPISFNQVHVNVGEYIVKNERGGISRKTAHVFEATYEESETA
jgi:hypothetical protein